MTLAKPADPHRVDISFGWKTPSTDLLSPWIGSESNLALLSRPTNLLVQGHDDHVANDTIIRLLQSSSGLDQILIHNRNLPEGCLQIIANRHSVETLQFRLPVIRETDAHWLSKMNRLKHVDIGQFTREPRQNDWSWLKSLPQLDQLEVTSWGANDQDVRALAACAGSRNLSLSGEMSDEALRTLCDLPQLEFLDLEGPHIRLQFEGKTFPQSLQTLDLRSMVATDDSLAAIAGLPRVNRVSIMGGSISDSGMRTLVQLPGLKQLWLDSLLNLTDEGMRILSSSTSLTEVHVARCGVTPVGLVHMMALPAWTDLRFEGVGFQRQPGGPKPDITAENVNERLKQRREIERMQHEVINGPRQPASSIDWPAVEQAAGREP